jgi:hypothetical protein
MDAGPTPPSLAMVATILDDLYVQEEGCDPG